MEVHNSPFQRRMRLLLAQEFAARGYYLDAESFYERLPLHSLKTDELELLVKTAVASGDKTQTVIRFEALEKLSPQSEVLQAIRAVREQAKNPGHCKQRWWQWLQQKCKSVIDSHISTYP